MLWILLVSEVYARNYFVNEGIQMAAASLASGRSAGVDYNTASSLASELLGSYVDAPPISSLIADVLRTVEREEIENLGAMTMPINNAQILEYVDRYKDAFNSFRAESNFPAFKQAVAAAVGSFDVKKLVADVQREARAATTMAQYAQYAKGAASFTADPTGRRIMASAQELYNLHNQVFNLHLPAFNFWLNLV